MARLLQLSFFLLVLTRFFHVLTSNVIYSVTFVPCNPSSTCPQGNPPAIGHTFALNGTLNQNLTASINEQLRFVLDTNAPDDPFTVCQRSSEPNFCSGTTQSDQFSLPITLTGNTISVTFRTPGIYYYGSSKHPGMGGRITIYTSNDSKSASINANGAEHRLSVSIFFTIIVALSIVVFH
ncbi:unnamed protein product [Adineta ricciae]|uniref:Uncharacterized protein n=1 Tax=Adineta ricciae TaxID=249248 RepID=A0A814GEC2_ADIRI|nr:unnamed protein product [Adineta ricciae]CAF1285040.1 unnamed protein product [Adineta ricciae]